MLYASSRFFHPEICRPLYNHANTIVNRMITHGTVDLPSVQAFIILSFWSIQNDESAYMKSGIAVRAAYQLRLWKKHDRPLPQDEEEVRAILDRERTWIGERFSLYIDQVTESISFFLFLSNQPLSVSSFCYTCASQTLTPACSNGHRLQCNI